MTLALSVGAPPVRVLGAYRGTDAQPQDALSGVLADLARAGLVTHRTLGPLRPEEAECLLDHLLEGVDGVAPSLRARVLQRAEGAPFFVVSWARGSARADLGRSPGVERPVGCAAKHPPARGRPPRGSARDARRGGGGGPCGLMCASPRRGDADGGRGRGRARRGPSGTPVGGGRRGRLPVRARRDPGGRGGRSGRGAARAPAPARGGDAGTGAGRASGGGVGLPLRSGWGARQSRAVCGAGGRPRPGAIRPRRGRGPLP